MSCRRSPPSWGCTSSPSKTPCAGISGRALPHPLGDGQPGRRGAVLRAGGVAANGPPGEVFSERLLSEVYDQPVEVLAHPRTGAVLVLPNRDG